jgi:hypothetical protein
MWFHPVGETAPPKISGIIHKNHKLFSASLCGLGASALKYSTRIADSRINQKSIFSIVAANESAEGQARSSLPFHKPPFPPVQIKNFLQEATGGDHWRGVPAAHELPTDFSVIGGVVAAVPTQVSPAVVSPSAARTSQELPVVCHLMKFIKNSLCNL